MSLIENAMYFFSLSLRQSCTDRQVDLPRHWKNGARCKLSYTVCRRCKLGQKQGRAAMQECGPGGPREESPTRPHPWAPHWAGPSPSESTLPLPPPHRPPCHPTVRPVLLAAPRHWTETSAHGHRCPPNTLRVTCYSLLCCWTPAAIRHSLYYSHPLLLFVPATTSTLCSLLPFSSSSQLRYTSSHSYIATRQQNPHKTHSPTSPYTEEE